MLLLLAFTLLAHADVPPANTEGCNGKVAGDSCQTDSGESGACKTSTCSRLDYSNGTPPGSVEYECLLCDASAAPADKPKCGVVGAAAFPLALVAALPFLIRRRAARA